MVVHCIIGVLVIHSCLQLFGTGTTNVSKCGSLLVFIILIALSSCADKTLPPAPVNHEPTLQKLAQAYNELSDELAVTPRNLNVKGKRKFVEKVFEKAGFSYTETLKVLAATTKENRKQYFYDLKQLALMPATGIKKENLVEIFSSDEINSLNKID